MLKKIFAPILLVASAYGCIPSPAVEGPTKTITTETSNENTNPLCQKTNTTQADLNALAADIFESVRVNTGQQGKTCLYSPEPDLDYLSNDTIAFWKNEEGQHRVMITPQPILVSFQICEDAGSTDINFVDASLFPVGFITSGETPQEEHGHSYSYTMYSHLTSNNIGVLEKDPDNTCSIIHNTDVNTCHGTNVLVEQVSDDFGTFWCVTVGSFRK